MRAPEQRANAQDQLAHAVRLHDVVVRADLEADDAVDLLAPRGAHDHRDLPRALLIAEAPADLGAGEIRQHEIEHDHVGQRIRAGAREAVAAVVRDAHREALGLEVVLERRGEIDFVFDDEDKSEHVFL